MTRSTPPRRILFLVYKGFEVLDLGGPLSVFDTANRVLRATGAPAAYETRVIALAGGLVATGAGLGVAAEPARSVRLGARDTLLVMGAQGRELVRARKEGAVARWLARAAPRAARFGSVCTGAFHLADAGLLDGRRAATHWEGAPFLARAHPAVRVEADALFVVDGPAWTSAGAATGVDMALAMVAADVDAAVMTQVARQLVVYACRPGHQSQFSDVLRAQTAGAGAFTDVVAWAEARLDAPLKVADLARRAGMSERTFARKFAEATGTTPAKHIERARLEKARQLLEAGEAVKRVFRAVGFRSEAAFRAAFAERFGLTPSLHRRLHGGTVPA